MLNFLFLKRVIRSSDNTTGKRCITDCMSLRINQFLSVSTLLKVEKKNFFLYRINFSEKRRRREPVRHKIYEAGADRFTSGLSFKRERQSNICG